MLRGKTLAKPFGLASYSLHSLRQHLNWWQVWVVVCSTVLFPKTSRSDDLWLPQPWFLPSSCFQLCCQKMQVVETALILTCTQHMYLEYILDQNIKKHSQVQFRFTLNSCFILVSFLFLSRIPKFSLYCLHHKKEISLLTAK